MRRRHRWVVTGVVAVMAGTTLVACGGSGSGSDDPERPVAIRLYDDVGSLDPALTSTSPGYQVAMFLYDRLVAIEDGKAVPHLAERWEVTPTSATFVIRKGITCDDGSTLTASAIAASMDRALDPATKAIHAPSYFPGGAVFTADDAAGTLTVTTPTPDPAMVLSLAHPAFSIICPQGLADPSKLASQSFGSGPYALDGAVTGSAYTLRRRDGYAWGPTNASASALPATVVAKVLPNESTAANIFTQGDLDITSSTNESAVKRMRSGNAREIASADSFAFVSFNQGTPVGADPEVRQAVARAVDPQAYAAAAQGTLATPSANLMPDVTVCAQTDGESLRPEFNLDAARETLEAAGWSRNSAGIFEKNGEPLTIRVGSHNQEGSAGEYLSQALEDLGAEVSSHQVELAAYVEDLTKGEWDVYASTVNRLDSPATLSVPFSRDGLDVARIRNPLFEEAMAAARNAPSFEDSCEFWKTAQDELVRNVDVVPQAHLNLVYFDTGVDFSLGFFGLIEPSSLARG